MCFRPVNVIPDSISSNIPTMADAEGMREDVCEEEEEGMDSSTAAHIPKALKEYTTYLLWALQQHTRLAAG